MIVDTLKTLLALKYTTPHAWSFKDVLHLGLAAQTRCALA